MANVKNILLPVGKYYNSQFIAEGVDCYQMKEMKEAAHIVDPIYLVNNLLLTF